MRFVALILFLCLCPLIQAQNFVREKSVWYEPSFEVTSSVPLTASALNTVAVESFHSLAGRLQGPWDGSVGVGIGYMSYSGHVGPDLIVSDLNVNIQEINFSRRAPYMRFSFMLRGEDIRKIRDRVAPFVAVNMFYVFMKDREVPYTFDVSLPDNPDFVHPVPVGMYMENKFFGLDLGTELKSRGRARFYMCLSTNFLFAGGDEVSASYNPKDNDGQGYEIAYSLKKTDLTLNIKLGIRL